MTFSKPEFDQLQSDRLAYVDGLRRNKGFEAGILRLLTQLYPDNAHFIYELLQNAEDAKASYARFTLSKEALLFEHDGSRLFSARDVESITSIGDSTKADSPTEIGKFGVGFKAVFAYTKTPEIHSGEYHFRIRDLVVPELLPSSHISAEGFKTTFLFPFDHQKKDAQQAAQEITGALKSLDDTALLFLSNICKISFVLPDGSEGRLERNTPTDISQLSSKGQQIQVIVHTPSTAPRKSNWLLYSQVVTIDDESTRKDCTVAIAFSLAENEGKTKKSNWKVVPLHPGRVSIYFPAEKETSNLRFHMHAPFASTVARDSVRDCQGNHQLLAALAQLTSESMINLRDRGLLTISALEVLPIEDDNLPKFYEPIREKLILSFAEQALVLTISGEYRKSGDLFRGPADIAAVLGDKDLALITGEKLTTPLWCANPPQVNQRADKFLDSLLIKVWGWEELAEALDCSSWKIAYGEDKGRLKRLSSWIASKEDAWLQKFYAMLHDAILRHHETFDVADLSFVRVIKDGQNHMVRPREAFFALDEAERKSDVLWVKQETYSSGKSVAQKESAKRFLVHAGVKVFNEKEALAVLLSTYKEGTFPNDSTHLRHIRQFVQFHKRQPRDVDVFAGKKFLRAINSKHPDKNIFCDPSRIYLDTPYEETGLASIKSAQPKYILWNGYVDLKAGFVDFVKAVGVQAELTIVEARVSDNENWQRLSKDYGYRVRCTASAIAADWTIEGIFLLLQEPSLEASRLIWKALIRADRRVAKARFRPNQSYDVIESESQLICHLKGTAWIPDSDGNFHLPNEISRTQLRADFPFDNQNGLLDAIGLESSVLKKSEEFQRKDLTVREIGFSGVNGATNVANAAKQAGLSEEDLVAMIRQHAPSPDQPEEEVRNTDRRRRGVLEHRDNAPSRESVQRERLIQSNVQGVMAEAKAYLRAKYTNGQGQMVCQVCKNEMPFKLGTGEHYFEAVQAIRGLSQHYYENRLALCPTCAAMYQYARACTDTELKDRVEAIDGETVGLSVELDVVLAGLTRKIRFVGTHFFDLRVVLDGSEAKD